MFTHIINYELKTILRNKWLFALILLIGTLLGFASYNGHKKVNQRTQDISNAYKELAKEDAKMLKNIALTEVGKDTGLPYWKNPTDPSVVGNRHKRIAAMDAQSLALISTGQSDIYSHFLNIGTYGNQFIVDNAAISNPIQLLFGTFDMAFVFIFTIPLLIIAFTYNILSKEKELGTLKVIGSQPVAIQKWLLQKMLIRFLVFAVISIAFYLLFVLLFSPQALQKPSALILSILQILTYELFWFVVSSIVNLKINNSSKNAIALVGIWLLVVLILPVTANQISSSLHPTPSRLSMINTIRHTEKDIQKKQDKLLDAYLRDHPELATGDKTKYNFWHKYFASQEIMKEEILPIINDYDNALTSQQKVVNYFKYFSPAMLFQESFNNIAGTSAQDYKGYKQQVIHFSDEWKNHIVPLLFKGEKYSKATYEKRPIFKYVPAFNSGLVLGNSIATLLFTVLLALLLFVNKKKDLFGSE